jgi:hypothetical protein
MILPVMHLTSRKADRTLMRSTRCAWLSTSAVLVALGLASLLQLQSPPSTAAAAWTGQAPSIALDPTSAQATGVHWTITLSAPYCGGFRIGDGVYLQPGPPLALPADVPAEAVLSNGQPADVSLQAGVLRVAPSHTLAQSMICQTGERQFTVELLGALGLTNPDAGDYAVDVRLGSGGTPQTLPSDNAALTQTFDAIRAQTTQLAAQAPGLASAQADLVHQLDDVQATGKAMAANGWNPSVAVAAPATDWAQGRAQADLVALHNPALQPAGAPPSSVATVISLVQLAQQQAQAGDVAVQQFQSDLEQLSDCGLGVPPAP